MERKLYGYFRRQATKISYENTWTWLRKGNISRETKGILTAALKKENTKKKKKTRHQDQL